MYIFYVIIFVKIFIIISPLLNISWDCDIMKGVIEIPAKTAACYNSQSNKKYRSLENLTKLIDW
jgi:hypothetical protein